MENNSDVVELASYAPIFVNENDAKWRPDMIRFSSSRVMGTPSYYVQQLMPANIGTQVVKVKQENPYEAMSRKPLTPKKSFVGMGSWGTKVTFVTSPDSVRFLHGDWKSVGDTAVAQTGLGEQCIALSRNANTSDHYWAHFKVRKDGGAEGFLIVFNYVDEKNFCWLNFGGWGNTQHAIEQISSGGKMQTVTKRGSVKTGHMYDVLIHVEGDNVKAWLDGEQIFDTMLKHDQTKGIFSNATINDATGEMIVKVVNTSEEQTTASLNLKNFTPKCARLIRLAANDGMDENTLLQPTSIHPVEQLLSPEGNRVIVDVPPYSLNIIRVKN